MKVSSVYAIPSLRLWLVGEGTRHRVARTAFTSMVTVGASMVTGILIARALGPTGRGYFASVMAWFGIAMVVGDVGQSTSLTYHVARWPERAATLIASSRTLMALTATTVALVGLLVTPSLSGGSETVAWSYRIAFIGVIVNAVFAPYVFATQATSLTTWNILQGVQPMLYLLLIVMMWGLHDLTLVGVMIALVVSLTLQGALSVALCRRFVSPGGKTSLREVKNLTRYGVVQSASAVPSGFGAQIDKMILAPLVGPAPLGQYAVASSVVSMATPLASSVGSAVFPWLARRDTSHEVRSSLEKKSVRVTLVALTGTTVVTAIAGLWLIPLLYGPGFENATQLLWWLAPMVIARSVSGVMGDLLRARGKPGIVAVAQWTGVVVTAVGLLAFTPSHRLVGAAWAVTLGQICCLIVSSAGMKRNHRIVS